MSWDVAAVTTTVGGTAVATYTATMPGGDPRKAELDTLLGGIATAEVSSGSVTFTGVSVGEVTIPTYSQVGSSVYSGNPITVSVTAPTEDESYLNKRGLTHFWENIDDIKQNKLTAGAGISITNDVISATGGGTADAVDWGHITGSMSNQTDLTTALAAKANSADLATVATSGSYNDLSNKPTIGNATITIQKNGSSAGTFTTNATSNKSINIAVPTSAADVSALPASTKYGASIEVTIDPSDFKVTTTLKDQDGNRLGPSQTIDLPLESMVVNGSYDSTNKRIILTLQSGSTINIPVGDLVAGLQTEITSTNKLSSDLVDDTNHTHKFVTAAQITKLNGIATGAEVNVQSDWNVTDTTSDAFIKNKPTIPTVNNGTLTIQKNGTSVATFTANQSGNATANITVPTIDDVVEINKTLAAVTDWTNTGIQGTDLDTGTYVVQVYTGNAYAGTWSERWSGIMSWYSGNTNSSNTEEILLHNAGHADNSQNLFLRTKRDGVTVSGTKYLTLQYAFSQANETTTTIKFSFRRII